MSATSPDRVIKLWKSAGRLKLVPLKAPKIGTQAVTTLSKIEVAGEGLWQVAGEIELQFGGEIFERSFQALLEQHPIDRMVRVKTFSATDPDGLWQKAFTKTMLDDGLKLAQMLVAATAQ